MLLNKCVICGGPRRSLTQEVCSRCRPKHLKNECPVCGSPKLVSADTCIKCHAKEAVKLRWSKPHSQKSRKDICPDCGGEKYKSAKYCSKCASKYAAKVRLSHNPPPAEITDKKGYVFVYTPDRKHSRTQRSHLVMEKILGRPIASDEDVHHINGIRDDDHPENLVVIKHREHTRQHWQNGKKIVRK